MIGFKLGTLLKGKPTLVQLLVAGSLGGMLGFMPGLHAGGVILLLAVVILVLRAPLGVAIPMSGLCKLVYLLALPWAFEVGRVVIDGPLQPVFRWLVNAPVTALMGWEYYSVVGGLVVGGALGGAGGLTLWGILKRLRGLLEQAEGRQEQLQELLEKRTVRFACWLTLGEVPEVNVEDPLGVEDSSVRVWGVVVAVVLVAGAGLWVNQTVKENSTEGVRYGLREVLGRPVDVERAEVDLLAGRVHAKVLGVVDVEDLEAYVVEADEVEVDLSVRDLLRRRLTVETVRVKAPVAGGKREVSEAQRAEEQRWLDERWAWLDALWETEWSVRGPNLEFPELAWSDIDLYFRQIEIYRQRLEQAQRVLERVRNLEEVVEEWAWLRHVPEFLPRPGEPEDEALARMIEALGYEGAYAAHLIEKAPALLIKEAVVEEVRHPEWETTVTVTARSLSDMPEWVEERPSVEAVTSDGWWRSKVVFQPDDEAEVSVAFTGLDAAGALTEALDVGATLRSGKVDVGVAGVIKAGRVWICDLVATVGLRELEIEAPSVPFPVTLAEATFEAGILGPLRRPKLAVDYEALAQALLEAGAEGLARRVLEEAERVLDEVSGEVTRRTQEAIDEGTQAVTGAVNEGADTAREALDEGRAQVDGAIDEGTRAAAEVIGEEAAGELGGAASEVTGQASEQAGGVVDEAQGRTNAEVERAGEEAGGQVEEAVEERREQLREGVRRFNPFGG